MGFYKITAAGVQNKINWDIKMLVLNILFTIIVMVGFFSGLKANLMFISPTVLILIAVILLRNSYSFFAAYYHNRKRYNKYLVQTNTQLKELTIITDTDNEVILNKNNMTYFYKLRDDSYLIKGFGNNFFPIVAGIDDAPNFEADVSQIIPIIDDNNAVFSKKIAWLALFEKFIYWAFYIFIVLRWNPLIIVAVYFLISMYQLYSVFITTQLTQAHKNKYYINIGLKIVVCLLLGYFRFNTF
jgi:hypothetical protein